MRVDQFSNSVGLINKTEIQKIEMLAFYYLENKKQTEFFLKDIVETLVGLGFARPNITRLSSSIKKSTSFNKGSKKDFYKLTVKRIAELREVLPNLSDSDEIISDNSILPEVLFNQTKRQYLIRIAQQINSTYEHNLFDACTLMMRRLLEILLIHCFEAKGIADRVKEEDGNYQNLKTLINKAITFPEIKLSNEVKKEIDSFRGLGNLAAHRIKYNCRKDDIRILRIEFRALIEELLYNADLIK